jgi:hypothetical protein
LVVDELTDSQKVRDQFGDVLTETQDKRPADVGKAGCYNTKGTLTVLGTQPIAAHRPKLSP